MVDIQEPRLYKDYWVFLLIVHAGLINKNIQYKVTQGFNICYFAIIAEAQETIYCQTLVFCQFNDSLVFI